MTNTSKLSSAALYISLLAFISFVVYILYIHHEVFYTVHDRSEFLYGEPYFHRVMSKPFGLMRYVGAWLTQFFYEPALGAGVLATIWVLIFLIGAKVFQLQGNASSLMLLPIACLLTSVVDLGYWIYVLPFNGYWFSQSVGFLLMLLLLWAACQTPRKWHFVWYLFAFCIYPLLGWFAMLFIICLILTEKPTWRELIGLILLLFTSSIWHTQFYSDLRFDDVVLAGLPRFVTPSDSNERQSIPFWVLGTISVLLPLCNRFFNKTRPAIKCLIPILCVAAGIIFTISLMFHDKNYINEMRMVRYSFDDNWKEVISLAEENKRPTRTMMFLKNVALMNEGSLLDRSFKLGNDGGLITNPDSLHVSLLDIASPLVYYNYGMMNEAVRLNFENAIQSGFSPFYLKMLARCALAQGDEKLVERYTALLHHHPFYRNWQPAPVTKIVKELQKAYPDELSGVENSDSYIVNNISLWNKTSSKVASEQALFYAMIRCDSRRFWASLRNYVKSHMDDEFPIHAQEAYILYMDKSPEAKRIILPVSQSVYDRYTQFWKALENIIVPGMKLEDAGNKMREEWGDTYWWYNLFARKYFIIHGKINSEIPT